MNGRIDRRRRLPALAAALAAALAFCAALVAQEPHALAEPVEAAVVEALGTPPRDRYDELFDLAWLCDGDAAPLRARLAAAATDRVGDSDADRDAQVRALWISSFVMWRDGDLARALAAIESIEQIEKSEQSEKPAAPEHRLDPARLTLRQALLCDALGRRQPAEQAYRRVLDATTDEALSTDVRLRLALLAAGRAGSAESDALAAFAVEDGRDPELRNRAAEVLALTGHPQEAIELFAVLGKDGTARFHDELRVAEWAIRAGDAERAKESAWRARGSARLDRDRNYALAVLVEAHRIDGSLPALIDRFKATPDLDEPARKVWIDLLRETGQVEAAVELFRGQKSAFTVEMQRELCEMYREAEREDLMIAAYRQLITDDKARIEWREGLSRHFLERGDSEAAHTVWASYLSDRGLRPYLLPAAESMMSLGLDDLATRAAETCIEEDQGRYQALLFLFGLCRDRGRLQEAEAALGRMDRLAPADADERAQLAEAYEQLGRLDRAVEILAGLRAARGSERAADDLDMRLAWLYSQVDDDEQAMTLWHDLWRRVRSIGYRRYAEDRLMTVASRLGKIADIVIELEEKLADGSADARDSGLLVRLYTKVNDPVSAAEVIDEYLRRTGATEAETLQEKAQVYLACTDYANYEDTLRRLMAIDADNRGEHLRHLVMSQLERGRPDEARDAIAELRQVETGPDSAEFEAGALALAGLRREAAAAYRRGVAQHQDRIEIYLLLANLMKETGDEQRAVGMFQHLAETAERDDLFTIAIDGLLNLEAPARVLQWARRVTLERMARRDDKAYLYQLLADLSEELQDRPAMLDALEGSLAIAGSRRPSILRELMDLSKAARNWQGDDARHLAYGRRLIGLEEIVPPEVYLDLGRAFLAADEVTNAAKTFAMATDLPDWGGFQRQVAELFENAGYLRQALATLERVLISDANDVGLMVKVGGLHEQLGRDAVAYGLYRRALGLLLSRRPLAVTKKAEASRDGRPVLPFARNVDEYDQLAGPLVEGLLVTLPDGDAAETLLHGLQGRIDADLAELTALGQVEGLDQSPRIADRSALFRRVALATGRTDVVNDLDRALLRAFEADADLLEELCDARLSQGFVAAARDLIETSARPEEQKQKLRHLVGVGTLVDSKLVPLPTAARLLLPRLAAGELDAARDLVLKTDLNSVAKSDLDGLPILFSAALFLDDQDLVLSVARSWARWLIQHGERVHEVVSIFERCKSLLDDDRRKSLAHYLVTLIVQDLDKAKNLLRILPELQKVVDEPILDADQITELLDSQRLDYPYGIGPILLLLPEDDRAAAVRSLWPKVPKQSRVRFLLTIASEMQEPIGSGLGEFILATIEESFREDDQKFLYYQHYLEQLQKNTDNVDLVEQMAERIVRVRPGEWSARMLQVAVLQQRGRDDEALRRALAAFHDRLTVKEVYEWRRALDQIAEAFLPAHLTEFLAVFDENAQPTAELEGRRIDLCEKGNDPALACAHLERAVAKHPHDQALRDRLCRLLTQEGRQVEALELTRRAAARDPKDARLGAQLVAGWRSLKNPVEALAARERLAAAKPPSGTPHARAEAPALARKSEPATIALVKRQLDDGDEAAARTTFRRLWRFGTARSSYLMLVAGRIVQSRFWRDHVWPADPDAGDDADPDSAGGDTARDTAAARRRGGLAAYSDDPPEPTERPSAYLVLATRARFEDEMRRQVRIMDSFGLNRVPHVLAGLCKAREQRIGAEAALAERLATVEAGRAGKVDYAQLLSALEQDAAASDAQEAPADPRLRAVLDDLVQTLDPTDATELQRLARVHARRGETAEAARLYRWCATLSAGSPYGIRGAGSVSARELVKDAKKTLSGDALLEVIELILELSEPGDDTYAREAYESLALETWEDTLGPDTALEKCRAICEAVTDVQKSLRRQSAKHAAALFARAGELDRAIACLEVGLCKLPTDGLDLEYYWFATRYQMPGFLSHVDYRRLFPRDTTGWRDPAAWLRRAAVALTGWLAAGRVRDTGTIEALCLIALRLHEAGAHAEAERLVGALDQRAGTPPAQQLWIADVARATGRAEVADRIERRLCDERRLVVERVAEVVERVLQSDGAAAALVLGESAAEYTLHPALLDVLVRAAEASGAEDRVRHWQSMIARAAEAEQLLKAEPRAR